MECFVDVTRHGKVDSTFDVVPVNCDAYVAGAGPMGCDFVVLLYRCKEMLWVLFAEIYDTKVINHKGELNGSPFVGPQSWDQLALTVPVDVEAVFEEFIGKETCLWKSIHAKVDKDIDGPIRFGKVL